jgi:hypothetical protein
MGDKIRREEAPHMAHFRGTVIGNQGEASRLGTKGSGLLVTAHAWNLGVHVRLYVGADGQDHAAVVLTEGSGYNAGRTRDLGDFTRDDLGKYAALIRELEAIPGGPSAETAVIWQALIAKLRQA